MELVPAWARVHVLMRHLYNMLAICLATKLGAFFPWWSSGAIPVLSSLVHMQRCFYHASKAV